MRRVRSFKYTNHLKANAPLSLFQPDIKYAQAPSQTAVVAWFTESFVNIECVKFTKNCECYQFSIIVNFPNTVNPEHRQSIIHLNWETIA